MKVETKITLTITADELDVIKRYIAKSRRPDESVERFIERGMEEYIEYCQDMLYDEEYDQRCKHDPDAYCVGCGGCEVKDDE